MLWWWKSGVKSLDIRIISSLLLNSGLMLLVPAVWKETSSVRRNSTSLWQRNGCGSTDWLKHEPHTRLWTRRVPGLVQCWFLQTNHCCFTYSSTGYSICHTCVNILHSSSAGQPMFALMKLNRGSLPKWKKEVEAVMNRSLASFFTKKKSKCLCSVLKYTISVLFINCLAVMCSTWQVELQSQWQNDVYCLC